MLKKWFLPIIAFLGIIIPLALKYGDRLILILDLCEVTGVACVEDDSPPKPCSPEAPTIKCAKHLFSNSNQAKLQVEILPDSSFKLEEKMQMRFLSKKKGQLLVFDINSEGALTQIMPNQYYQTVVKLEVNKEFIIPETHWKFNLPAEEPLGKGVLLTILIEDDIDLKSILPVSFVELNATMAKAMLQHLHDQLKQQVILNGALSPRKWSGVFSDYEIKPRVTPLEN